MKSLLNFFFLMTQKQAILNVFLAHSKTCQIKGSPRLHHVLLAECLRIACLWSRSTALYCVNILQSNVWAFSAF